MLNRIQLPEQLNAQPAIRVDRPVVDARASVTKTPTKKTTGS